MGVGVVEWDETAVGVWAGGEEDECAGTCSGGALGAGSAGGVGDRVDVEAGDGSRDRVGISIFSPGTDSTDSDGVGTGCGWGTATGGRTDSCLESEGSRSKSCLTSTRPGPSPPPRYSSSNISVPSDSRGHLKRMPGTLASSYTNQHRLLLMIKKNCLHP